MCCNDSGVSFGFDGSQSLQIDLNSSKVSMSDLKQKFSQKTNQ